MKTAKKNSKNRSQRLKKVAKRLAAYSAAAAATVMTTGDRSANATEVIWDIADVSVSPNGSARGVFFNMINGATYSRFYLSASSYNNFNNFTLGKFALEPFATQGPGGYLYAPAYNDPNSGTFAVLGRLATKNGYPEAFASAIPPSYSVSASLTFIPPPPERTF